MKNKNKNKKPITLEAHTSPAEKKKHASRHPSQQQERGYPFVPSPPHTSVELWHLHLPLRARRYLEWCNLLPVLADAVDGVDGIRAGRRLGRE